MPHGILCLILAACVAASPARAQSPADSAAAAGVREVAAALGSGRVERMAGVLEARLHPDQRSPERLARQTALLAAMHDRSRGFRVEEVRAVAPGEAAARLRSRLTGWDEWLAVRVEAAPPFRVVAVGAPSAPLPAPRPPVQARTDPERVRELERFMERVAGAGAFSGVVLLARGDSVLFARGYGLADRARGVPNRVDTRFRLESITKPMTAVAVAQLAERGRLSLEDTLGKFFPDFPLAEARRTVRVKHLLAHTSGLADYLGVCRRVRPCPNPPRTLNDYVRQVEIAQGDSLRSPPGTRWAYNSAGYVLLGRVVEIASGEEFRPYLRARVLAPAGMRGAGVPEPLERPARLAVGYEKEFTPRGVRFRAEPSGGPEAEVGVADNGVYATAGDVLRFVRALLAGRLVGPDAVRAMTTARPELGAPSWGLGFGADPARGTFSHGGSWAGASNSVDHWTAGGYTAVVLSNHTAGRALPRELIRMMMDGAGERRPSTHPTRGR